MRPALVILSWLALLWVGFILVGELAGSVKPKVNASIASSDIFDRIDWKSVQDPWGGEDTRLALQSYFYDNPLSGRPFAIRVVGASGVSSAARTEKRKLAEHLKRISPRSVTARAALAELAYSDGNYAGTVVEISQLMLLDRNNTNYFVDLLTTLGQRSQSRRAVEQLLKEKPSWGAQLVSRLATELEDTELLISFARDFPSSQSAIVRGLVRNGETDRAYTAFLEFLNDDVRQSRTVPFDRGFNQLEGSAPFTWQINHSFASFENRGGLSVSFFGQGHPSIAEQIIKLSSGVYKASFTMQGDLYRNGGHFEWTLKCLDARDKLFTFPIMELSTVPETVNVSFSVPSEGCDFQLLRFSGVAGEFPRTARASVTDVFIYPALESDEL
ncbi:tetratricopeptide repeat protein [Henriciella algicola]|uniref:Uncharacterized protein n=1 Tax=Henriciella algicola TaxID=1608422 RepID=A0A399RFE0_9PROT|nr:hypothetical protein [Henriciella algicola]RIJ29204.1 hypothetical protein D1222_12700 [Henriciella algicola]